MAFMSRLRRLSAIPSDRSLTSDFYGRRCGYFAVQYPALGTGDSLRRPFILFHRPIITRDTVLLETVSYFREFLEQEKKKKIRASLNVRSFNQLNVPTANAGSMGFSRQTR